MSTTPANILGSAQSFYRAAEICYGTGLPADQGKRNEPMPAVVCFAFATELAIKAILCAHSIPSKKQHDLDKLFALLPQAVQASVRADVDRKLRNKPPWSEPETFDSLLADSAKSFEVWRYVFEREGMQRADITFLRTFCCSLMEHATAAQVNAGVDLSQPPL